MLFGTGDYDAEFDAIFGRPARPVADPVIYVARPDDPTAAPPGHEAWFVLVERAARTVRPASTGRRPGWPRPTPTRCSDRLAARGLAVADRVLFREIITPGGSGTADPRTGRRDLRVGAARVRRVVPPPGNTGRVRGLYLVGGSTHPGGGLPMVVLSAAIVADLIGPA